MARIFHEFLFDFLLLPYGSHPSIKPSDPNEKIQVPPGLSEAAWKRVSGESMIKPEELEKLKANVVKFFGNGLIHEKIIAMHLVIGMADTRHSVSTEADTVMRRVQSGIDWNEKVKVDRKIDPNVFFIPSLTYQIIVQQILIFWGEKHLHTQPYYLGPTRLLISEIFPSKPDFHLYK